MKEQRVKILFLSVRLETVSCIDCSHSFCPVRLCSVPGLGRAHCWMAWEGGRRGVMNISIKECSQFSPMYHANTIHNFDLPPTLILNIKSSDPTLRPSDVSCVCSESSRSRRSWPHRCSKGTLRCIYPEQQQTVNLLKITEIGSATTLGSPLYGTTSVILSLVSSLLAGVGEFMTL